MLDYLHICFAGNSLRCPLEDAWGVDNTKVFLLRSTYLETQDVVRESFDLIWLL
jgi:hypothetical protein